MKTLIVYATTDGQTRKVARFCADDLIEISHSVELLCAADAAPLDLRGYDRVVLAGSLHAGGFQKDLMKLAKSHAVQLQERRAIFLAVSLSAAGQDEQDWKGLSQVHRAI
jgi:menaquinone-dependent protoporphyrinogen oxidase